MGREAVKLAELRKARKLSQAKLAKELGFSPATIALYELGLRTPRLDIARHIAAHFGVSLDDLEFANAPRTREAGSNG